MSNKIIIHNDTPLPDTAIIENYILPIMKQGKISELTNGRKQYCFGVRFNSGIAIESYTNKEGTTDTFKVFLEDNQLEE